MASATQVNQDVQDRVLETMRVGQEAVVVFVRSWAETVETAFSKLPEFTVHDPQSKPGEVFGSVLGFTERWFASQRDFAQQLFEAVIPATRPAPTAGGTAAGKPTR